MIAYAVVDDALSRDFPLGVELEVFIRREDAERFVEEVRGDDPEIAAKLRIEGRKLEADGPHTTLGRDVLRCDIIRASREEEAGVDHHRRERRDL